jgi:hypothetical protein
MQTKLIQIIDVEETVAIREDDKWRNSRMRGTSPELAGDPTPLKELCRFPNGSKPRLNAACSVNITDSPAVIISGVINFYLLFIVC